MPRLRAAPSTRQPELFTFASDGSVVEGDWHRSPPHSVARTVASLVNHRRKGDGSPAWAAEKIVERGQQRAFPCHAQWAEFPSVDDWPRVPTRTSAEQVVKDAGNGYQPQHGVRAPWVRPGDPDYGRLRLELVKRIIARGMTPAEVADVLETIAQRCPQVQHSEIDRLRASAHVGPGTSWAATRSTP